MRLKKTYTALLIAAPMLTMTCYKSMAQRGEMKTVPKPVTEYSHREHQGEVFMGHRMGWVEPKEHGFLFLRGTDALPGNVRVEGTIGGRAKGMIELRTNPGVLHMYYALPAGMQLPVELEEHMNIDFRQGVENKSSNFTMMSEVGKKLLHVSARRSGDNAVNIAVTDGLKVYQQPGIKGNRVPVMLNYKGTITDISKKAVVEVEIEGQLYNAIVVLSSNIAADNPDVMDCRLEFVVVMQ